VAATSNPHLNSAIVDFLRIPFIHFILEHSQGSPQPGTDVQPSSHLLQHSLIRGLAFF